MTYIAVYHAESENIAWMVQDYLSTQGINAGVVIELHPEKGQPQTVAHMLIRHASHECDVVVPDRDANRAIELLKTFQLN